MRGRFFCVVLAALLALAACDSSGPCVQNLGGKSIARHWDEQILSVIRIDLPNPPVHSRNLYHLSAAMYDAWAAYDGTAAGVFVKEKHTAQDVEAARNEAISYAAYRVLRHRYALSINSGAALAAIDLKMLSLCYSPLVDTTEGDTPAALGNRIASTILSTQFADGSNEGGLYANNVGYLPVNTPLIVAESGVGEGFDFPNRWQPLALEMFLSQNGLPVPDGVQQFQAPHWTNVTPFALEHENPEDDLYIDPGEPPLLGDMEDPILPPQIEGGAEGFGYVAGAVEVAYFSSLLDPTNGIMIDISPAGHGNNPLGEYGGEDGFGDGYAMNPYTGEPYTPQLVPLGDWGRVIAEFWADGPQSETPPGHWNVLANELADNPLLEKRIEGTGPIVDDLEWDVKVYLALNGGMHDAAIAAWEVKVWYDYVRPISMIRYMGSLGQSTNDMVSSYDPNGLPLVDGFIEIVTAETTAGGQRHEHLAGGEGKIAIRAWGGAPVDMENDFTGTEWILAEDWSTYQRTTFVTPAFAGYVSGHSTFSRNGAEVLSAATGSEFFPGGLYEVLMPAHEFLEFEDGPSVDIRLQYARFQDAADEAGISRLFGGIHVRADDLRGRIMGAQIGQNAWAKAKQYYDGTIGE